MRVLLTGSQGYVGSHVGAELRSRGHAVTELVRNAVDASSTPHRLAADLTDIDLLAKVAGQFDAISHHAASDAPEFAAVNSRAVAALLQGMAPDAAFVMQGGSMVFGDTGATAIDESRPFDPPPPLAQRASLESAVLAAGATASQRRTFIAHAALVYGDGKGMVPTLLLNAARRSGQAAYVGDGLNRWSPVHVADWARLIVDAIERGPGGGHTFFAAAQPSFTMQELAARVATVIGAPKAGAVDAAEAARIFGFFSAGLALDQRLSATKAQRLLGWQPQFLPTLQSILPD